MTTPPEPGTDVAIAIAAMKARDLQWEESLPERDRATAQATVDELRRLGRLRTDPVPTGIVRRVIRDEAGRITGTVETVEQVEPPR